MYISLERIKNHLNIDNGFVEDDDYITFLEDVATKAVQATCNVSFDEITEGGNELPSPLLHACLLLIGDMYQNRESVATTSISRIPTFRYLCANFTDYKTQHTED